jgi:cytochrome c-type biogenesis protein CcmH
LARGDKIELGQNAIEVPQGRPPAPADQQAMIEGMVARLASRLQTDGNDPSGWVQLMRSYKVLGRNDDAVKALQDARKALAGNNSSLDQINTAASELGIEAGAKDSEQK